MAIETLALFACAAGIAVLLVMALLVFARLGRIDLLLATTEGNGDRLDHAIRDEARIGREESQHAAAALRAEVTGAVRVLAQGSAEARREQGEQFNLFAGQLRQSASDTARQLQLNYEQLRDQTLRQHAALEARLLALGEVQSKAGETLRGAVETQLASLRKENGEKLDQMRVTVDEKLQGTLEARLTQSFQLVSGQLEAVHKGLGEMQTLASGVGDLKRVLTNVKTRGSWGEVQLGALLEQVLTPDQYVTNAVMAPTGAERVEFAVRMPGQGAGEDVFLPIDAKFPIEDYERLQAAADAGDIEAVDAASKALEARLKGCARDISEKYVHPPRTTDFAILFLPTEGLYAEALRRPGLADELHKTYRVTLAGPTTLTAVLSSLQMGFRTLAIQKRSSEVWQVLGAVKTEFGKFEGALDGVHKKLQEATNKIGEAQRRSRVLSGSLRSAEALPAVEATTLLGTSATVDDEAAAVQAQFFASPPQAPYSGGQGGSEGY